MTQTDVKIASYTSRVTNVHTDAGTLKNRDLQLAICTSFCVMTSDFFPHECYAITDS